MCDQNDSQHQDYVDDLSHRLNTAIGYLHMLSNVTAIGAASIPEELRESVRAALSEIDT